MKLSARPLIDCQGVNDFIPSEQLEMAAGDSPTFYFQLIDLEKNLAAHGWSPPGMRYVPVSTATAPTLVVTFVNIDDAKQFSRFASQPYAQDASIWSVGLLATDPLAGTVSIKCVLTENLGTSQVPTYSKKSFTLNAAILVSV